MSRIRRYLPRPALVVAIVAVVLATTGSAFAIGQFGVGKLREGARQKVVGVGKLVRVSQTANVPVTAAKDPTTTAKESTTTVTAFCPGFPIGNLQPISGGVKLEVEDPTFAVLDSHPITNGWTATVYNKTDKPHTVQLILSCARSLAVSGPALPSS